MGIGQQDKIVALLEQLQRNDHLDPFEQAKHPPNPQKAMRSLIQLGPTVIKPLKELALTNLSKYSSDYAVDILGEVPDQQATKSLLEILDASVKADLVCDGIVYSLEKQGPESQDLILNHAIRARKRRDWTTWNWAMEGLKTQKSPKIVDEILQGLNEGNEFTRGGIPTMLATQEDKRVIPTLIKLLKEEDKEEETFYTTRLALRELLPPSEYRQLFESVGIIGSERNTKFAESLARMADDMRRIFWKADWEGDNAEELNQLISSEKELNVFNWLFEELEDLLIDEGYRQEGMNLKKIRDKISKQQMKIWEKSKPFQPLMDYSKNRDVYLFKDPIGFAYPKLATSQSEPNPHLEALFQHLTGWLHQQNFRLNWRTYSGSSRTIWIQKKKGDTFQTANISLRKSDSRRALGEVKLQFIENNWSAEDTAQFEQIFWKQVNTLVDTILNQAVKPEPITFEE